MPDDEINQRIINPLPTGARLYAVVDACHSGSSCDLPYQVSEVTGMRWASTYSKGYTRVYKGTAGGRAIQISACSDQQTAADTNAMSRSVHTGEVHTVFPLSEVFGAAAVRGKARRANGTSSNQAMNAPGRLPEGPC